MIYRVHYMKPEAFSRFIFGTETPTVVELPATHVHLMDWTVTWRPADWTPERGNGVALGLVFHHFQAERWSPNGEACELIEAKGLAHTSMSVGDVIEDGDGVFWAVANRGFVRMS